MCSHQTEGSYSTWMGVKRFVVRRGEQSHDASLRLCLMNFMYIEKCYLTFPNFLMLSNYIVLVNSIEMIKSNQIPLPPVGEGLQGDGPPLF